MNPANALDPAKILYVDDDEELVDIFSQFLQKAGYRFKTAPNADDAYHIAEDFLPDMIISDVAMPGTDGFAFCRKIRQNTLFEETLFILVSGIDIESDDVANGFKAGADDYLLKPFSHEVFTSKIASLLRIRHNYNKYKQALIDLEAERGLKQQVEKDLIQEKELLNNSLKQITYMVEERDALIKKNRQLEDAMKKDTKGFCAVLSELIESKPQYHRGHSVNVADIAASIARTMGLSDEEIADIKMAALLHETGKLNIPDELSLKTPENYSPFEADFLAQHPVKGASLLGKISALENVSNIIRHIHEYVDGTGFPSGARHKMIPVGSLIIAAVSAYDNRVLRLKKQSPQAALDALESEIGSKYDFRVIHQLRKHIGNANEDTEGKPIELRIYDVKPGMTLAAGVFTTKGAKLLSENCVLTTENIAQLAQYHKIDLVEDSIFVK